MSRNRASTLGLFLTRAVSYGFTVFLLLLLAYIQPVGSVGCFVCHSVNKSDPLCEDPFNGVKELYHENCYAGRKNRSGRFPGTSCIKLTAWRDAYTVVVRDCTVDNGDTTSDTEMGRESHCGMVNMINYNDINMNGCALACHTDGCNTGSDFRASSGLLYTVNLVSATAYYLMTSL